MMDGIGMGGNRPKEVSLGSDALDDIKALRADEIVTKDGQNSFRTEDSATHRLLYEILNENKKQTQLLEFIYGEEL